MMFYDEMAAAEGTSLHDTVSSGEGTPWDLHPAAVHGFVYDVTGTEVHVPAVEGFSLTMADPSPATPNYYIANLLYAHTVNEEQYIGVIGRLSPTEYTGYSFIYNTLGSEWAIELLVEGEPGETLGTFEGFQLVNTSQSTATLYMNEDNIYCSVFGNTIISITDGTLTDAGVIGISHYSPEATTDTSQIHIRRVFADQFATAPTLVMKMLMHHG